MRTSFVGLVVTGMVLQAPGARAAGADAAASPRGATVSISAVKSSSDAAVAATRATLRERQRELVACYDQELAEDPEPTTRVTLSWRLRANGSISAPRAEFPDPRLDDAAFAFLGCLKERAAGWTFRKPGAGSASVEVALTFSAGNGPRPAQGTPLVGSIGKEAIRKVLDEHSGEITACYQRELAQDKSLEGKVKLKWTVQADGSVADVKVDEAGTTLPNRKAIECIASRVGGWRFPPPKDGAIAVITNAWTLRTQLQVSPKP